MKVILKDVPQFRWVSAVQVALTFFDNYKEIQPHHPVIMGKIFQVHNTKKGTVVVQMRP